MRHILITAAVIAFFVLMATTASADKFNVSGGFRVGQPPHFSQNPNPQAPGDAYTRTNPGAPFVSNPGDAYYDTTIRRNQGFVPTEFRRQRPEPGPERVHPIRGSEIRVVR